MRRTLQTLEQCRKQLGEEVELIHDVHERIHPAEGAAFARELERYRLFFLEDLFSPEQIDWFRTVRAQCATPMAAGEKIAALGEVFGVRTAWHGPPDVSPVGRCANIALELACYNFGVHEYTAFGDAARELFRGCPVARDGYVYANEAPGWGIEIDEKLAAKYPYWPHGARRAPEKQRRLGRGAPPRRDNY